MKAGRKNLKKAAEESLPSLEDGESIMQVVSLRGTNIVEVMDAKGVISLALFPAKFQKSFWIRKGSFLVVDEAGREKALESGSKITCMVSRVLFHEQARVLAKSPEWPARFRTAEADCKVSDEQQRSSWNSDGKDGVFRIEANQNRRVPVELSHDSDSDSE